MKKDRACRQAGNADQLKQKIIELENSLKRALADFDNYKKQQEKHRGELMAMANYALILKIVPVLDNFRRAFKQLPKDLEQNDPASSAGRWVEGVKQVEKQLEEILKEEGIEKIQTKGTKFDPTLHEAITHEEHPQLPSGHIIEEIESGYLLAGKVIKPAKVRVSKGK